MNPARIPLDFERIPLERMLERAEAFRSRMSRRRTVRDFAPDPVPRELIARCIATAGSAPSGANQQPWRFVAVSDPAVKKAIREAAEAEEREFYGRRATEAWREALAPLGTDANKPFLETAPWLIAVFYEAYGIGADGARLRRYYPADSTGIATGLLIAALHDAGLATLTHTPSPMGFLNGILGRPENERPFVLLVAGFPAAGATVPAIERHALDEIATFL